MSLRRPKPTLYRALRTQLRIIWALMMREVITRFGREGLGSIWVLLEPAMFVIGVVIIWSNIDSSTTYSPGEYLAVSYPTMLLWRNGTNRVTKALEVNRALLHHQPIRPLDIIYARILLEFSGAIAAFTILFIAFIEIGICHWPADLLRMILGYFLVIWFSGAFALIMAALSELTETIERVSHLILYFMLPFSGVFVPAFAVPERFRDILLYMPLVDAVEYFHAGYYGSRMKTYYHLDYTIVSLLVLSFFAFALARRAVRRVQLL